MADDRKTAAEAPVATTGVAADATAPPVLTRGEMIASAAGAPAGRRVYQASVVRKTVLSLVFLLLLPFFASLPAMLYQRLSHQLWTDSAGFAIFAGCFTIVMLLVVFELIHSIRSRVEIDDSALRFTLPAARAARMPKLRYRRSEIPFSAIEAVELRREVYGGALAPVLLRGARIITKDGEAVPLGYISEANVDPTLPLPEIAEEVARRAGVEIIDRGSVRRDIRKKLMGVKTPADADDHITNEEVAALNRRHNNIVLAICGALFLLVAGGLFKDIANSSLDFGERAQHLIQQTPKASPQAQKK